MKIYVDFDRTLFDCDRFLGDIYALMNKYNITKEMFVECQNQCIEKGFNPYLILDLVKEKYNFDNKLYQDLDLFMEDTSNYLYSDASTFLNYLKLLKYEVIILSKGNIDYQKKKIMNSHIDLLYSDLIITRNHKGDLGLDYINSIFIDDNPKEILSIMNQKPKKIIRLQRDDSLYANIPMEVDILSYKTLQEIIDDKVLN